MPITAADIKLLESERMTDTTDGGGRRTSRVIPDGEPGNIFSKVSRLDSVYGRVNLLKVFAHVDTPTLDTYGGAHAAIIDDADNSLIKVNIFTTNSDFDDRTAARDRIESYVVSGPESRMWLYGRQLVGQQAVTCLQRVEDALPDVGDVYCLSTESGGVITYQQYVRVGNVAHEVRVFTDQFGDYTRRMVTLTLTGTLRYEFVGLEEPTRMSATARAAIIRTTTVADASRYSGIAKLAEEAAQNALEIKVDSVFSAIVPTTTRETAINNVQPAGAGMVLTAGSLPVAYRVVATKPSGSVSTITSTFNLGGPVGRGTVELYVTQSNNENRSAPLLDDGVGAWGTGEALPGYGYQILGGEVDYTTGVCSVTWKYGNGSYNGALYARYVPAAAVNLPAHTLELPVTINTRGTVHTLTLNPLPSKGTVYVDFRALGKWYRLKDDGDGELGGDDPQYGSGTVDPVTGALVVTLGALPDVGSSVLIGWGSPAHFEVLAAPTADADTKVRQKFALVNLPVKPATLSIKYTAGVTEYTATADVTGVISGGDVSGKVVHTTGEVELQFDVRLPNPSSQLTVDYQQNAPVDPGSPTTASGTANLVAGNRTFATVAGVAANSVKVTAPFRSGAGAAASPLTLYDDGAGGLWTIDEKIIVGGTSHQMLGGQQLGTINYATGEIVLVSTLFAIRRNWYTYSTGGWSPSSETNAEFVDGSYQWWVGLGGAANAAAKTEAISTVDFPPVLDVTKTSVSALVAGSVRFTAFGLEWFDRNGVIYHTMAADGTGTAAGTVNYESGAITFTSYPQNTALGLTVQGCLGKYGDFDVVGASFRTAGSPLRAASTFVQVTAKDGELLTATTSEIGDLIGDYVRGGVNQQFGIVSIEWGAMVPAAGNETEPWYKPENVVGANVWKPREVMPETLRYSAVVLSNLPLDADRLGLDPVRLPTDGRVPIFRAGDVVLLHNTKYTELVNPVVAGATYNVGRTALADLVLYDTNNVVVPTTQYLVDLAAGTVTMAADMNLGALVQPLQARHRIEELNMASDVQINGLVSLTSATTRVFDVDTRVSGCLLFGDLFGRATNVFDQQTWTAKWSDYVDGDGATGQYDTVNYPVEVQNDGAVTERWRLNFTSATAFQVIGENLGVIATGSTATDCAPVNSLTAKPYFLVKAAGWGAGWATGNQLRFNTVGASAPIWMLRTVLPGAPLTGDSIDLQLRGDVDA